MRTRWPLLATVVALTSPAHARSVERPLTHLEATPETVTLRVDSGAILARADIDMHPVGDAAVGTLTLTLTAKEVQAASTVIALPRGARVVGMSLDHGDEPLVARPLALSEANRRFVETVEPPEITVPRAPSKRDPAVLQLERTAGDIEWVRLTVFPISPTAPATVTVQLAMPRFERMQLYVDGRLRNQLVADQLAPATAADAALASRPALVEAERALYAAPPAPAPSATVLADRLAPVLPTLGHCAAVDDREVAQAVSLQVHVDALGRAWLDQADGAGVNLKDCLQQVVEHIQFADDAPATLTYGMQVLPQ